MIARLLILVALLIGTAAQAQTVRVRSGEHADFTRLIFRAPPAVSWEIADHDDGKEITFRGARLAFNLDQVFRTIPRSRLASISAEGGRLRLDLACLCEIDVYRYSQSFIIIDIRRSTSPPEAGEEIIAVEPAPETPPKLRVSDNGTPRHALSVLERALALPEHNPPAEETISAPDLSGLRAEVSKGVARAVSQGLLAPREIKPLRETAPAGPVPPPVSSATPPDGLAQVAVSSAVERAHGAHLAPKTDAACAFDLSFAHINAEDAQDARDLIAGLWQNIAAAPTDRAQKEAHERAALAYLSLGFGAEARALLQNDARPPMLMALSYIVDDQTPASNPFAALYLCDTPAALWALLSAPEIPEDVMPASDVILRAYLDLPAPLQKAVLPRIMHRLSAARFTDLRARLAVLYEEADMVLTDGTEATRAPKDPVQGAQPQEVLLAQMERHIGEGTATPEDIRAHAWALLPSLAPEAHQALLQELVLAESLSGAFPKALAVLVAPEAGGRWGPAYWSRVQKVAAAHLPAAEALLLADVVESRSDLDLTDALGARRGEAGFAPSKPPLPFAPEEQAWLAAGMGAAADVLQEDSLRQALSRMLDAPPPPSGKALAAAEALLAQSTDLRQIVGELLQDQDGT